MEVTNEERHLEGAPDRNHGEIQRRQQEIPPSLLETKPEGRRSNGFCKWFNVSKGFGFLVVDATKEEIFVHQSELQMPGFRSLENGERVQFSLRPRQVRPKESEPKEGHEAYFVTAEVDGESLKGSSVRPLSNKRKNQIRCYNCGAFGNHIAAKCKKVVTSEKVCYECKSSGHLVAACPTRNRNREELAESVQRVKEDSLSSGAGNEDTTSSGALTPQLAALHLSGEQEFPVLAVEDEPSSTVNATVLAAVEPETVEAMQPEIFGAVVMQQEAVGAETDESKNAE